MMAPDVADVTEAAVQMRKVAVGALDQHELRVKQLRALINTLDQIIAEGPRVSYDGEGTKQETWAETLGRLGQNEGENTDEAETPKEAA